MRFNLIQLSQLPSLERIGDALRDDVLEYVERGETHSRVRRMQARQHGLDDVRHERLAHTAAWSAGERTAVRTPGVLSAQLHQAALLFVDCAQRGWAQSGAQRKHFSSSAAFSILRCSSARKFWMLRSTCMRSGELCSSASLTSATISRRNMRSGKRTNTCPAGRRLNASAIVMQTERAHGLHLNVGVLGLREPLQHHEHNVGDRVLAKSPVGGGRLGRRAVGREVEEAAEQRSSQQCAQNTLVLVHIGRDCVTRVSEIVCVRSIASCSDGAPHCRSSRRSTG